MAHKIRWVIGHNGSLPAHLADLYAAKQQHPVRPDVEAVGDHAAEVVVSDFLAVQESQLVRHNLNRLIEAIFAPARSVMRSSPRLTISAEAAVATG